MVVGPFAAKQHLEPVESPTFPDLNRIPFDIGKTPLFDVQVNVVGARMTERISQAIYNYLVGFRKQ